MNEVKETYDLGICYLGLGLGFRSRVRVRVSVIGLGTIAGATISH